jgi:hypothetical protein
VQDTGEGIPDNIKPKLFQPLVTSKSKGQGFGLAVVKRLVEALKGDITFESERGKGTKFIVKLPTETYRQLKKPPTHAPQTGGYTTEPHGNQQTRQHAPTQHSLSQTAQPTSKPKHNPNPKHTKPHKP